MDKILFICEGEKTERKFCNYIIDRYFIKNQKQKEYVAFKTNIYSLYNEVSNDEGLDIVELIKEKAKQEKRIDTYNKLANGGFSEIYLIFDFDFHAIEYSYEKVLKMIEFFDNETENGKIYINYPMMESFKHFKDIPDYNYNSYKISKEECMNYKKYINQISKIIHFNSIDENTLKIIIKQNLDKFSKISNSCLTNYEEYQNNFSQKKLLDIQIENLNKENSIYIFNTSLFWGIDYFGKTKFDECNNICI